MAHKIEYENKIWTLAGLADHVGLHYETLRRRLFDFRLPVEEAVKKTIQKPTSLADVELDLSRHRKKPPTHKVYGPIGKVVNEPTMHMLTPAKKQSFRSNVRNIKVPCIKCGYIAYFSINSKRDLDTGRRQGRWLCRECLAKDKAELREAMINLAKNKKAAKK